MESEDIKEISHFFLSNERDTLVEQRTELIKGKTFESCSSLSPDGGSGAGRAASKIHSSLANVNIDTKLLVAEKGLKIKIQLII